MDFSPQSYAPDGTAVFATDTQLLVKFFNHPQISKFKSEKEGVPMMDDVEMISVIQPGEKEEIKTLATDFHRRRFPRQYEAFKKGLEQTAGGTPLDHLYPSQPATVANLRAFNIFTIQQLAAISDSAMIQLPMGRTLCDQAKAYLSSASGGQNFHAMQAAMRKEIDELKAMLGDRANDLPPQPALNLPDEQLPPAKRKGRKSNAQKAAEAAAAGTPA